MTKTIIKKVTKSEDLNQLREITKRIIGETCWSARISYGDELSLHIGEKISYSSKSMAGKQKGSWILGTRATPWQLISKNIIVVSSQFSPETIKEQIYLVEDTTITAFETNYLDLALVVSFNNGCQLMLFPDSSDQLDLPYYELFTPNQMVLQVGAGAIWSYLPSDLPD